MFKTRIPVFYLLLSVLITSAITFLAFSTIGTIKGVNTKNTVSVAASAEHSDSGNMCDYNLMRLKGYQFIKPVFLTERECPSVKFTQLESRINEYIAYEKTTDSLQSAAVYLIDFSQNEWMVFNDAEKFHPGSLAKIAILITYLRMAETTPSLLDRELLFDNKITHIAPLQTYNSKTIKPGNSYKIRDLLHSMIAYSDNYALVILNLHLDMSVFKKMFTDLGMAVPDINDISSSLTVKEYSKFLRVLYDAGYLTIPASEYAMSLLAECDFNQGMKKELPTNVKVAHKFGQWGDDNFRELHESGIIYLNNRPYLLTIMTRGKNLDLQAALISHISKMTYDYMITNPI